MIDTVVLETEIGYSSILNRKILNPVIEGSFLNQGGFRKFIKNPTKEDKRKWGYLPKLTIFPRGKVLVLRAEFSVQQILNIGRSEPEEKDFEKVVGRLREVVEGMGVLLSNEWIKKAEVLVIHPYKDIILSKGYSSVFAIRELSRIDISRKFDVDCKEYRNGGEVLYLYSNQHGLSIYDKIRDSKKPPKRAFDKEQTTEQKSLFVSSLGKVEILRIEARLKKEKFKDIFEKIGYDNFTPSFEDVFKKDLSQKILKYYWNYFFGDNLFLFDMRNNPQRVLSMVLAKYKDKKMPLYKLFGIAGLILCSKDEEGTIGVKNILKFYKSKNNWSKTKKWLDNFKRDLDKSYLHGFIKDIETQLNKFEPFRIDEKS